MSGTVQNSEPGHPDSVPIWAFATWLNEYASRFGRESVRAELQIGGERFNQWLNADPDDTIRLSSVDRFLTRAERSSTSLATLYPDVDDTPPTGRKRGKPVGKHGKMTDAQIRAAHVLYVKKRMSLRALGRQLYEQFGFASAASCAVSLSDGFLIRGLSTRGRIEATIEASTTHGLASRESRANGDPAYRALRNQQRRARGEVLDRPRCAGVRQQYPRLGQPCGQRAQVGSDYCWAHDPARSEERDELLRRMRAGKATA